MSEPNIEDPILHLLRRLRHQAGLSLDGVEKRSNGDYKAVVVGSYERGHRNPSLTRVRALLNFYGYDLAVVRLLPDRTEGPTK